MVNEAEILKLKELIGNSRRMVFFGGAAADRLHCMVGRDPLETTRALRGFFRQVRQEKSLCRL